MGDSFLGLVAVFSLGVLFGIVVITEGEPYRSAENAIAECEAPLPRDQVCHIIAVPPEDHTE